MAAFDFGKTSLSIDWQRTANRPNQSAESDSIGLAVVQTVQDFGIELYAGYRYYDLFEQNGPNLDAVHLGTVGTRVRF